MTKRKRTFAEIAAEVRSRPAPIAGLRPGLFGPGGFSDPGGRLLQRTRDLTPAEAQEAVAAGAVVAFEGCGCGGSGGCAPEWFDTARIAAIAAGPKPRFVKGHGSPTWIDRWDGDGVTVVFGHGDVEWNEPG